MFADYATLVHPGEPGVAARCVPERHQDLALVELLLRHPPRARWWLGYLDTGASDIVFWDAPVVMLYTGWRYVLIEAGPEQAATWRPAPGGQSNWKSTELPDLMFPEDHTWLVSTLWDVDWSCVGGSQGLIMDLLQNRVLGRKARRVALGEDATPLATLRISTRTSDATAAAMGHSTNGRSHSYRSREPRHEVIFGRGIDGGSRRQLARVVHPVT